jgi:archaemetzincin
MERHGPDCVSDCRRILLGTLAALLVIGCWQAHAAARFRTEATKEDEPWEEALKQSVFSSLPADDTKGFQYLSPPKPGEWLSIYTETPQSIEKYQASVQVRPTDERRTIVLQPLGTFNDEQAKLLDAMRDYAALFFQLPVRLERPLPIEAEGKVLYKNVPLGNRHGKYDKQYNADRIMLDLLAPRLPKDALVYLGITMEDLYAGDLRYVFGVATLSKRVGVYSLCRYFPEFWGLPRSDGDDVRGLRRACKVLNHETGHMFNLRHCVFYRCSMNGSNSLTETDAAPIHYCPVCHRKLQWNIGFDPAKRYGDLREFYQTHGMNEEAEWIAGRLKRWNAVAAEESLKKIKDE